MYLRSMVVDCLKVVIFVDWMRFVELEYNEMNLFKMVGEVIRLFLIFFFFNSFIGVLFLNFVKIRSFSIIISKMVVIFEELEIIWIFWVLLNEDS